MSTSNLSGVIQGGQTLGMVAGAQAINANDLVQTGGPGNEAYSVVTIDNAAVSTITTTAPTSAVAGAVNNYARYDQVVDTQGNSYFVTPNASSQGVNVSKRSPGNTVLIASTALDATAHAMISMRLRKLTSGNFVAVYADSTTGGVKFVIFDTNLTIIAGPTAVATGYAAGAVAYVDGVALSGGGFAVLYQSTSHVITLQTYSNAGAAVLAATSVQTITGAALVYLALGQLSNGNLVIGMRTTATPAGTSFVIVTTAGVSVVANTVIDSIVTAGFCHLSILPGFFALADANGTNLQAAVYNNAGAQQGGNFTGATTLNSTTYAQCQLANDGNNFYLFFTLTAGGLSVVQLTTAGASTAASATILTGTFTTTTTFGAAICNGQAFVLAASITTGGQHYITVGLPDAFLGASSPYVITGATSIGSAAATTGSYWPSVHAFGDFTAGVVYDQQTTAGTFAGMVKFAASAIQGVAQNAVAANAPGTALTVNPGPGSYPVNALLGTAGTAFDHSATTPVGNRGVMYQAGTDLSNPSIAAVGSATSPTGFLGTVTTSGTINFTALGPTAIYVYTAISSGVYTVTVNGVTLPSATLQLNPTSFGDSGGINCLTPIFLSAGQVFAFVLAATGSASVFAQKVN